jgi:hypothetical protein
MVVIEFDIAIKHRPFSLGEGIRGMRLGKLNLEHKSINV